MSLPKGLISIGALGTVIAKDCVVDIPSTIDGLVVDPQTDTAHRDLLTVIAGMKFRERAGWKPFICDDPLPKGCIAETKQMCSPQVTAHLFRLLAERDAILLEEWTAAFIAKNLCITPEAIPKLLEMVSQQPDYRPLIRLIVSERLKWLTDQRDDGGWYWLNPHESDWDACTPEERIAFIYYLREVDPTRARQIVESVWAEEGEWMRRQYLEAFENGLSLDDEPLLEFIRQTGSRKVELKATTLLGRLPESTYCRQLIDDAKSLIRASKRRGKLTFKLDFDRELKPSIVKALSGDPSFSKLGTVGSILGYVPPQHWLDSWNVSADDLLRSVIESRNLRMVLLEVLTIAAYRFRDCEFAGALLPYLWQYSQPQYQAFYRIIPQHCLEAEAMKLLTDAMEPFGPQHVAGVPLSLIKGVWSEQLTITFLDILEENGIDSNPLTAKWLGQIARRLALAHLERFREILTIAGTNIDFFGVRNASRRWETTVDTILQLLDFRREMLEAIQHC